MTISMRRWRWLPAAAALAFSLALPAGLKAAAIDGSKVVDLTYSFGPDTIYWPTAEPFSLTKVAFGETPAGYFYAANNLCLAEHGADKPAFENVAHLDRLPPAGATIIALPMKIAGGSGGPTRVIALLP